MERRALEILTFWFGDLDEHGHVKQSRAALWWKGAEETDRLLRDRFADDLARGAEGQRDHWAEHARGRLALIITLDQFPRSMFRGTPRAFAADARARELCLQGLARDQHRELGLSERVFFYMPLEHAEDRDLQRRSVELFEELLADAPGHLGEPYEAYLDYAVRHRDIVERFGRFPHRNAILGRASTAEELAFLEQPGSSFG